MDKGTQTVTTPIGCQRVIRTNTPAVVYACSPPSIFLQTSDCDESSGSDEDDEPQVWQVDAAAVMPPDLVFHTDADHDRYCDCLGMFERCCDNINNYK